MSTETQHFGTYQIDLLHQYFKSQTDKQDSEICEIKELMVSRLYLDQGCHKRLPENQTLEV